MKLKIAAVFVALFLFANSSVNAQKETVILYNSQAVKVELSQKGTIQSFISVVPDYMAGYDVDVQPNGVIPEVIEEPVSPALTTPFKLQLKGEKPPR